MIQPYQKFGKVLHTLRRTYHETRTELCAALEITAEQLDRLEQGKDQPSEDFIEQLIGHFSLNDALSTNLWVLAGYPSERLEDVTTPVASVPMSELKASYTDMVHVSVNNFGVIINFMQNLGPQNQPVVVSRLGMSKEHARSMIDIVTKTIELADSGNVGVSVKPKQLPHSTDPSMT